MLNTMEQKADIQTKLLRKDAFLTF